MNRMDEIHGLLSGLLNTFATAQSLAVKWEGQAADPSTSTYLREWLIPGESTGLNLGLGAPNATPFSPDGATRAFSSASSSGRPCS
jgi:hypothetical protein